MPSQMEMNGGQNFKGGQNFLGGQNSNNGNTYNNQGGYNDYRSGQVWHEHGDKNTYYTTDKNRHYDNSTNFNGAYHEPATHYYGPVNNVGSAENVISGGFVNQGKMRDYNQGAFPQREGGKPSRPAAPARPSYDEYSASPRRRPAGPGPAPYDPDVPTTESAAPQYQDRRQQRPPRSDLEGYDTWGDYLPPERPPRGSQDYPQQPSRNPKPRAKGTSSRPQQPPPQQRWQGAEKWAGESAYRQGMANLKEAGPPSWNVNGSEDSDSSDQDGSDEDEETVTMGKRMGDPNRLDQAWIHRGPPQPAPDQFWPRGQQRRRAPPPFPRPDAAYDNYEEDDDGLDLSSLSLGDVKKTKKEHRNPRKIY